MTRPAPRTARLVPLVSMLAALAVAVVALGVPREPARLDAAAPGAVSDGLALAASGTNPVTPGDFTGYGFDQCLTPTQPKMDAWLEHSPFLAVGIYISGNSRACRSQPNLTPAWVSTQLRKGWRLLPITLGPQASCLARFPRYDDDPSIISTPGTNRRYDAARAQGTAEAIKTVGDALALGLTPGSTLFYDLEGFDSTNTNCRESALSFLSAWTDQLHAMGWVSGVYSSAGSGIAALDQARRTRPGAFTLPDQIWIARWDGIANTSTTYIAEDGWRPGGRIKQYRGGHDERWGGVTINIDSNYLEVGRGSVAAPESHCGGVNVDHASYLALKPRSTGKVAPAPLVKTLQCLLKKKKLYTGKLHGRYNNKLVKAARAWQGRKGLSVKDNWSRPAWMTLVAAGKRPVLKTGSAGTGVRRLQRALNAASGTHRLPVDGVFGATTDAALRAWQQKNGLTVSGVAGSQTWSQLRVGNR